MILLLALTGIYQTITLWLNQTSSNNLLDMSVSTSQNWSKTINKNTILSTHYAIGSGDGLFSIYYPNNMDNNLFLDETSNMLHEIISDRNISIDIHTTNWRDILKKPCIIMQYDFLVDGTLYFADYPSIKDDEIPRYFDYLILCPDNSMNGENKAYFINSTTNQSFCYSSSKSIVSSIFYSNMHSSNDGLVYISTDERTMGATLERNIFIPQWSGDSLMYAPIIENSIFQPNTNGAVNSILLENVAKGFFSNFSVDWNNSNEIDGYMFSDNETIVRYSSSENILEYFNYNAYGNTSNSVSLINGYLLCTNFMKNDISLSTPVYLANIQTSSNETTYFFNYSLNNLPIIFSSDIKSQINSEYAIEITIKNDVVKKYKRYMVNYTMGNSNILDLSVPFIDALDSAVDIYKTNVEDNIISDVTDISLGYYIDPRQQNSLKWFVSLYGNTFIVDSNVAN